jgi:Protein of unknown function (DUF3592)
MLSGMFMAAQGVDDALDNVFAVVYGLAAIGGCGFLIWAAVVKKYLPLRASMFSLSRSTWPITEAVVTRAVLQVHHRTLGMPNRIPNALFVWFEYEVAGVKYSDVFTAASPGGGPSAYSVASEAAGEKLMIRYNPKNPADAQPLEKSWHDLKVWWIGKVWEP